MTRGLGGIEAVQTALPDILAVFMAVVTQFGDVFVFIPALSLVVWFGERDQGAALIGIALGAIGIVLITKEAFAFGRPPANPPVPIAELPDVVRPFFEAEVTADGYGFPSGHATAATVVWGSLAWWLDVGSKTRRIVAAVGLVALVAFSRIALGVHYLVDVIAGIGLGLAYLVVVAWIRDRVQAEDALFLWLAVGLTVTGGALQAGTDGWLAAGAALGATAGWYATDVPIQPWPTSRGRLLRAAVVFLAFGALSAVVGVGLVAVGVPGGPAFGVSSALIAGAVLAVPGSRSVSVWIESRAT